MFASRRQIMRWHPLTEILSELSSMARLADRARVTLGPLKVGPMQGKFNSFDGPFGWCGLERVPDSVQCAGPDSQEKWAACPARFHLH